MSLRNDIWAFGYETTHEMIQTSSSCEYKQPQETPTRQPVTLPLKSMYSQMFCKNIVQKL